jgi:hypothetical protein
VAPGSVEMGGSVEVVEVAPGVEMGSLVDIVEVERVVGRVSLSTGV